jgi:proline dehydrogenase
VLRGLLIGISENRQLRALAERSAIGLRMSRRFVPGTIMAEVLAATEAVNRLGMSVSIDNLGENVTSAEEARHSAEIYHRLLQEIETRKLQANVSLKLTHMGLEVDERVARELVGNLIGQAGGSNPRNFVRIDMEGSAYTQRTLALVHELHRLQQNKGVVGAVIQAYLYRSEQDVEKLVADGIRVRLCKGAYKEPPEIAFQKKSDVDANYVKLMKILLKSGIYHGIATHDPRMIDATTRFATTESIPRDGFEFQMLYGIRRDLQRSLVRQGWRMRVYIPFGTEWYPYLMRRLAERPANLLFLLKNVFR